jgi:hypothetical protein
MKKCLPSLVLKKMKIKITLRCYPLGRTLWGMGWVGTSGRGEVAGKRDRRMYTVQKMYTHVCKCKVIKGNCARGEFKYDILDTL